MVNGSAHGRAFCGQRESCGDHSNGYHGGGIGRNGCAVMKTKFRLSVLFTVLCTLVMVFLIVPMAHAAGIDPASTIAADPTTAIPVDAQNAVLSLFLKLAVSHSWIATVAAVMAMFRLWAKPLSSAFHALIDLTPTKYDDSLMTWFTTSATGQFIAYLVDWVTSIKIVPPKQ